MRDYSGGHLDRFDAAQHAVCVRSCLKIAFVDPQPCPETVGVATAMRGMVAMSEEDFGHRPEGFVPRRQLFTPTRRVDHQISRWAEHQVSIGPRIAWRIVP